MPSTTEPRRVPAKRGVIRLLRRLGRDERGVTAVEFALIALPFLALLVALIETAILHLTSLNLENAVRDASRLIRTGQAQVANMSAGDFRTRMCEKINMIKDCNTNENLHLDVRSYDDFGGDAANPPPLYDEGAWTNQETFQPGAASRVVIVRAYYKVDLLAQIPGFGLAQGAERYAMLDAISVFRNEPF
jgi:Flp pilus assembly protein TadG